MGRWGGRDSAKAGARDAIDATPEQIAKVRALYERPGTPGEKAAAAAALKRMGIDPAVKVTGSAPEKLYTVILKSKDPRFGTHPVYVKANSESEAKSKASFNRSLWDIDWVYQNRS